MSDQPAIEAAEALANVAEHGDTGHAWDGVTETWPALLDERLDTRRGPVTP
ncbi:hypothetical protein ABZ917_11860 [Nonomuraea wenchangensis]